MRSFVATCICGLTTIVLALPTAADAHGLSGREDLPVPAWLFAWAASAVLVVSFVGLAVGWTQPRLQHRSARHVIAIPRCIEVAFGALGVGLFALVVYAGLVGVQVQTTNIAPTAIFVIFWVGVACASMLFGNIFAAISPWRAIGRAVGWAVRRIGGAAVPEPLAYPQRLGCWPAAATIVIFGWVELVDPARAEPSHLAVLALVYCAIQLVGISLYGERTWTANGDGFGLLFAALGRISPLAWERRSLALRPPLSGLTDLPTPPGTVAFACALIGVTSFDGFSMGSIWLSLVPHLQSAFAVFGIGEQNGLVAASTLGLLTTVALIGLLYHLGVEGVRSAAGNSQLSDPAVTFAHTLIPIGGAYFIAHYFSMLLFQGQTIAFLISDPLGRGSDLFGTAGGAIDYTLLGATTIWYVQIAALVGGHICGLILAHDRALAQYGPGDSRLATRSQYWMLAVMVAFTSTGLWLLSEAAQ